jgi:hypothetical protein
MAVALVEHQARRLALELRGKGTTLLGHQTPLCGEHSRLNGCPVSLDHYRVHWADGQIGSQTDPAYELIELALMTGSNRYDTASQLLRVGTPTLSRAEVLPYVLAEAHKRLVIDPGFGEILAVGLYQSWFKSNYDFPESLNFCGYFQDAYSLAESGIFGTVDQIDRELLKFMARFYRCDRFMSLLGQ